MSAATALTAKPEIGGPLGGLKRIDAGLLNVGYAEASPGSAPAALGAVDRPGPFACAGGAA